MPLSGVRQLNNHTWLGFWEITETTEVLLAALLLIAPAGLAIPAYQNAGRQAQWLASRLLAYELLQEQLPALPILTTNQNGKPVLADSHFHISISHTNNQAVVLLSDKYEVGIDIENMSAKVLRVRHKFLSDKELAAVGENAEKALVYWCAKEALYKLYSKGQVLFREHLFVEPFELRKNGILEAYISIAGNRKKYRLPYEIHPSFILTYCVDSPENSD